MRIVVVGAGKVGYYLIKTLLDRGHEVSFVERDGGRCRRLAEELDILAVNGDGTDLATLVDAGADEAEVVAAVTGRDEVNLVVCQLAKKRLKTKKVVARVNNPKNREVLQRLGVDIAVSGTALIADAIEEEILWQNMRTLLRLRHRNLSLLEVELPESSPAEGRAVRDLAPALPPGCILVALVRGEEVLLPRGSTVLAAGDVVVALVQEGAEEALRRVLQGLERRG
ncbi:MAG: TrkA family potassium uptake protein [Bacillota bacterium]|nr:TrkA family potassium uptake protein [Bacillota bacterium]